MILKKTIVSCLIKTVNFSFWCVIILSLLSSCGNPTVEKHITQKVIKEYYIECDTNDFINIYQNFKENNYIPIKITYNGESRIARMRIRGDTSRKDPKNH